MGPLPVLGFREWTVRREGLISTIEGHPWPTAAMEASCVVGHPAPFRECSCGIYAIDGWPRLGDPRLYEQAAAPLRLLAVALLTGCVVAGLAVLLGMDRLLISNGLWGTALPLTLAMLVGLAGVAAADIFVSRVPQPYMLGAVVLTGKVLRYENGVFRAERAQIACLVRPLGVSRPLAGRLAEQLGVPCFDWWDRERALRYLSEHGDLWTKSADSGTAEPGR
jgi:hypothetical protein